MSHGTCYTTFVVDDLQLSAACDTVNATLPHYQRLRKLYRAPEPFSADNGLLTANDLERALAYGTAHGALAMTTPGDVSMASLAEVEALALGGSAHVRR